MPLLRGPIPATRELPPYGEITLDDSGVFEG